MSEKELPEPLKPSKDFYVIHCCKTETAGKGEKVFCSECGLPRRGKLPHQIESVHGFYGKPKQEVS